MNLQGHLSVKDSQKLINFLDHKIKNLNFKSLIQFPEIKQLLASRFHDATED